MSLPNALRDLPAYVTVYTRACWLGQPADTHMLYLAQCWHLNYVYRYAYNNYTHISSNRGDEEGAHDARRCGETDRDTR